MSEQPTYEELEHRIIELEQAESKQKKAEKTLIESEQFMNSVFESIQDGISILNPDLSIRHVNGVMKRWYSENLPLEGKKCFACYHNANKPCDPCPTLRCLKSGKPETDIVPGLLNSDVQWIELFSYPVRINGTGNIAGVAEFVRDITERKKIEEALRKSEEKFREFIEGTDDLIAQVDHNGRLIYVNHKSELIWGLRSEDCVGLSAFNFIHPDDRKITEDMFSGWVRNHVTSTSFQNRQVNQTTGEIRHIQWTINFHYDKNDNIVSINSIARDLTELIHAEETIKKNEMKFRFLTESMMDIVWTLDLNFQLTYVGPSVEKVLGYTPAERLRQSIEDQMTPESFVHVMKRFQEEIERDETKGTDPDRTIKIEVEYYHRNGSTVWMENNVRAIRDDAGKLVGMHGVSRNITDRKQAEKKLFISEERYQLATHGGKVGVWDWNFATGEFFISPNLKAMLGYMDHEIKNHIENWNQHIYADDVESFMKKFTACLDGLDKRLCMEHRMVNKDGSIRWFLTSGEIEIDEHEQAVRFLGTATDITEKKQLEEQVLKTRTMESLGTLTGGVAHEFNNILGIILGNAELAADDIPEWNPANESLNEILSASLRGKKVVSQLLRFVCKMPVEKKPIHIRSVVEETLKLMQTTILQTIDLQLEIQCQSEMILANPEDIRQVVMNLCTNAVQAMDDKGILRIKLEKICLDGSSGDRYWRLSDGEYVRLTLSDTGSGIEPDLLDRIFEPYFTTKPVDRGLGMGLAVVHGIVENCNGAVKIKSQVGEGTTVEILFPIIETELAPDSKPIETLPGGTERVLIVDDEASLVKLSEKILTKLGYHVVGRTNSIEALDLFKKEPNNFDLVITDMAMPQLRGDRLITELRKIRSDIPIVLCTGYSDRIDQDSAKTMGINALLNKPVEKKNLAKTVRKMLDGSAGVFEQKPTVLK